MYVELFINGEQKRLWHFENSDYKEAYCQVGVEEKEQLWKQIIDKCKLDAGPSFYSGEYQFWISIRPRLQPKDIADKEYAEFIEDLDRLRSGIKIKYQKNKNHDSSKVPDVAPDDIHREQLQEDEFSSNGGKTSGRKL